MGAGEFVAFIAAGLVVGAVAVDLMLPALHAIGDEFGLARSNLSQAVIAVLLIGIGPAQLLFGPLSDRYGRRPMFLAGLLIFVGGSVIAALAPTFEMLLAGRLLQGFGVGAVRVVTLSIARDRHGGMQLARVMSLAMTGLLLEPVLAPMLGQLLLNLASWRWLLATVAGVGVATLAWAWLRLGESLAHGRRRTISPASLVAAYRTVARTPAAVVGILIFGLILGAQLGFLSSAQGIFQVTYAAGVRFTPLLALVSSATVIASFANARLVRRHGSRRLIQCALCALVVVNAATLALAAVGGASLPVFMLLQACGMFAFGLLLPNLTAMVMNPLGSIAGTAASVFGFISTTIAAPISFLVGFLFDGTIRPVAGAYVTIGLLSLLILTRYRQEG
ncbi:multidrug effflux MFS transporter [Azoarcus sp. KH32C]|uniref:multidrug effflux MFS transporter n=1 Tax=Azoarcus sp. KH32C TaxID=748247 RepID=UPI00023864E7|nr:multidrug effflux MFS transporter [Azoarcus sp. KH32C]BAL24651.1 drug resistance transporter, Bcr/CflA subfamily [Azoarcus sp. KH32C]